MARLEQTCSKRSEIWGTNWSSICVGRRCAGAIQPQTASGVKILAEPEQFAGCFLGLDVRMFLGCVRPPESSCNYPSNTELFLFIPNPDVDIVRLFVGEVQHVLLTCSLERWSVVPVGTQTVHQPRQLRLLLLLLPFFRFLFVFTRWPSGFQSRLWTVCVFEGLRVSRGSSWRKPL